MTSVISRHFDNFVKSDRKCQKNFAEGCFSVKLTKRCEKTGTMLPAFAEMTSLTVNSTLCKFITREI